MTIRDGTYSYVFDGHAMITDRTEPWYIVGLGTLNVQDHQVSDGDHTATLHRHNEWDSRFTVSKFEVAGQVSQSAPNRWDASLVFQQTYHSRNGPLQVLKGTFEIVPATSVDRYWLISTGARLQIEGETNWKDASEVVRGEISRIGNLG